jgi:hypothetical protein
MFFWVNRLACREAEGQGPSMTGGQRPNKGKPRARLAGKNSPLVPFQELVKVTSNGTIGTIVLLPIMKRVLYGCRRVVTLGKKKVNRRWTRMYADKLEKNHGGEARRLICVHVCSSAGRFPHSWRTCDAVARPMWGRGLMAWRGAAFTRRSTSY